MTEQGLCVPPSSGQLPGPSPKKGPLLHGCAGAKFEGLPEPPPVANVARELATTITADLWVASLPRWLAKSRTSFGAFLCVCQHFALLPAGSQVPAFRNPPHLPIPHQDVFQGSGPRLSKARWAQLRRRRLVNVLVLALNYLHGFAWVPCDLLRRFPNGHQSLVYDRLWKFVVACDARPDKVPLPPGRSGPDLLARLCELEAFASLACGADGKGYAKNVPSVPVPRVEASSELPQLQPYRALDPSFLAGGNGTWRPT